MLNLIKMDLYRMFRTKSLYVIWIVLAAALLFTTILCKTDYEILNEADAVQQEQVAELTTENINVGMMVTLPTEPGEKVTVFDIFFGNSQGKFYALFLVIFVVLFSTADISSGYIKNKQRGAGHFQSDRLGCLYNHDIGRGVRISGSGKRHYFWISGMGRCKGDSALFRDGGGSPLCAGADLYDHCSYFEEQCDQHGHCSLPYYECHDDCVWAGKQCDSKNGNSEFSDL